jgi:Large polyvalent protein-associated domain 7
VQPRACNGARGIVERRVVTAPGALASEGSRRTYRFSCNATDHSTFRRRCRDLCNSLSSFAISSDLNALSRIVFLGRYKWHAPFGRLCRIHSPENAVHDLDPFTRSRALIDWLRQRFRRVRQENTRTDVSIMPETSPPAHRAQVAQFPGLVFGVRQVDLDERADQNDAAIRAGLIYFKHRWPGERAEIEGSDAFRVRAWRIAEEVGVSIKGPHPRAGTLAHR